MNAAKPKRIPGGAHPAGTPGSAGIPAGELGSARTIRATARNTTDTPAGMPALPGQEKQPTKPLRVGLISLGCAKNLVDGEIILGTLLKDGIEITNEASQADALIVNTCSFIESAQQESVDAILESAELREAANRGQALIVSG